VTTVGISIRKFAKEARYSKNYNQKSTNRLVEIIIAPNLFPQPGITGMAILKTILTLLLIGNEGIVE